MKPKLLFISSRPLYPITGGDQIRTVQQLELLKEKFDIDVLYMTDTKDEYTLKKTVDFVSEVYCFRISRLRHWLQTLKSIYNGLPLQVSYYLNSNVVKTIRRISVKYDVIFCNNIRTAEYARNFQGKKILDFVDAISMNYEKAMHQTSGIKKLIYAIDYRRCKRYERECLTRFDGCAVISEVDKQYILS